MQGLSIRLSIEVFSLFVSVLLFFLMRITKPDNSRNYRMVFQGNLAVILTIILRICLLMMERDSENLDYTLFVALYLMLSAFYIYIFDLIFFYINSLSYQRRHQMKYSIIMAVIFDIVYVLTLLTPVMKGNLISEYNGTNVTSGWQIFVIFCATMNGIIVLIASISNRKYVSKVVLSVTMFFIPIELCILLGQIFFEGSNFISISLAFPFVIAYCLFHCRCFDVVIGCQEGNSADKIIERAIAGGKRYLLLYVRFPQLQKREFENTQDVVDLICSKKCRELERINHSVRLYRKNVYTFLLFSKIRNDNDLVVLRERVKSILSEPITINGTEIEACYKVIVFRNHKMLTNPNIIANCAGYFNSRFSSELINEVIVPYDDDYEKYEEYARVEKTLQKIKYTRDLDDPRVLCYVQMIHSIKTNSFRTAEALMRMEIDGKMIFPDVFIPIAEALDCIHVLTLIIVNKVCRKIKELEENGYSFDAISVNCSTQELADEGFHEDLLEIIDHWEIQPSHLRVEITESTTLSRYDTILYNMKQMNERGVSFYLDDFGTGYSNLERIVNYPFNTIKFDKSILYNAMSNDKADQLMKTLVEYFLKNGFATLVEGVENPEQYEYSKNVGFQYIQGYMYSRPLPIVTITDYFENTI